MISRHLQSATSLFIIMVLLLVGNDQQFVVAQTDNKQNIQEIDAYVREQMDNLNIPGVAIGIIRDNEVFYVQGYGVADNAERAMTPQTPFPIASLSKSFTALGIMQLVEEGKINLDDPIQTYLSWFQVADKNVSSKITIRHLLYQTSGFSELEGHERNLDTNFADDALETAVRNLSEASLNFAPGTAFEYSNTNYDILGLVIQTVSGQTYETYIQEQIFAPLEMNHSYTSLAEAQVGNLTRGYYPFWGFQTSYGNFMPPPAVLPSAGLFSSAEDLTHYLIAHLDQGQYLENSILSPNGIIELHTVGIKYSDNAGYAMGWTVFPFTDASKATSDGTIPTGIAHRGEWLGFNSILVQIPELETGIVVLMNKSDQSQTLTLFNIGWSVSMLAIGLEPYDAPPVDFVTQNLRGLLAATILLLGISLVWSISKLRHLSLQNNLGASQKRKDIAQMILLLLVDLLLAGGLLLVKLPQDVDSLNLALHFKPDVGLMYVILLVLTLGWGVFRTILFFTFLLRTNTSTRMQ